MDDPFVTCPYVATHRVPLSRLQGHLVKCQKNHPELQICPYNATHRFPVEEMKKHVTDCPARVELFPASLSTNTGALSTPKPILQREYLPDPQHDIWDD